MTAIEEIKARLDIVDVVSETVQLRRSGKNYTGFCPFHENTRTPAFVVFPDSGTWRCFGQCNEGGDIFSYVMKREGWDFPEALRLLAERAGVELTTPTPEEQEQAEENQALRDLLESTVLFYRHQLFHTTAGQEALRYLREQRNLTDETIEAFGLGYAPDSWDATTQYFLSKGHTEEELLACGLVSERDSGGVYDRFRHRVMFPIRDHRGRMAGFGARILRPDDVPKFLNSPQTEIFDKSGLLYGLDRARRAIREADRAVIVEGYLDVIALHQAGFTNAISPMGTALSERQLRLLKRYSRRITLALDPDAAGDKATLRGLEVARETLDREEDPVFDAQGLLGYEGRLQADIRVASLPDGLDPDEVVHRDPQEWERILASARPIVIHVMQTLAADQDLEDPKVKADIAGQVLPLIADVPNAVERDAYVQRLARLLKVAERSLMPSRSAAAPRRRPARRQPVQPSPKPTVLTDMQQSTFSLETFCLSVLLRRPDLLYQVDRNFLEANLPRLSYNDFQHSDHSSILRVLLESVDQDLQEPFNFAVFNFSLPMVEAADDMLGKTEVVDPRKDKVLGELMRALVELRRRRVMQSIEYLRFLQAEAQDQGDIRAAQYGKSMVQHTRTLQELDLARARYTGESRTSSA